MLVLLNLNLVSLVTKLVLVRVAAPDTRAHQNTFNTFPHIKLATLSNFYEND